MSVNPVQDERGGFRRSLQRFGGTVLVLGATALKWAFLFAKVFAVFVSFALYSYLFHSWEFGLGLVLLILVHEMGHFVEAKRQGLSVTLPQFVPFFGAYVKIRQAHLAPWNSALVSLAGPFVGSIGAAAAWGASSFGDAQVLVGLANIGFLLNAFNLLPIGFLDGGSVARAIEPGTARLDPIRERRADAGGRPQPRGSAADHVPLRSARGRDRGRPHGDENERSSLMQHDRALLQTHHSLEYLKEKSVTIGKEFSIPASRRSRRSIGRQSRASARRARPRDRGRTSSRARSGSSSRRRAGRS